MQKKHGFGLGLSGKNTYLSGVNYTSMSRKSKSKVLYLHEKQNSDGEITTETKTIERIIESPDKFFKTYIDDIAPIIKCTNAEKNFIICCSGHQFIEYETNELVLTPSRREKVAECSGITERSIQNIIYKLIAKKILLKYDKSVFLNPKFFFTGSEQARGVLLSLQINYALGKTKKKRL